MKLNFKKLELYSVHPWKLARTETFSRFEVVVVEIVDSNGRIGLGEAAPISRYQESAATVERFLASLNPDRLNPADLEQTSVYLNSFSADDFSAKCAINVALADLAAKREGKCICDWMGLSFEEGKHVTSFTIGIDSSEVITTKVIEAQSFPILKMKIGSSNDEANLVALRKVAPNKPIRTDANEAWKSKEQALRSIEWLAKDENIQFVEQPMPASAPTKDWIWLKQRSPLPIFADESYHSASDAALAAECFHGVNVKLVKSGGITGAMESLKAARQAGLQTMLGCMIETSILISAAAHLASLCDYLDLDGNLLITNDPYLGVTAKNGLLSFRDSPEPTGLRVVPRRS